MGRAASCAPPDKDGADHRGRQLHGGALLLLGESGRILAQAPAVPPPLAGDRPLVGSLAGDLEPPALGDTLHRLWARAAREAAAATAELVLSTDPARPEERQFLSFRVAPHPEAPGLFLVTLRNLTHERSRVQLLLRRIESLEAQRNSWEDAAHTLAHDLRSSLGALTGFVRMALERSGELPETAATNLGKALEVAARLRRITLALPGAAEAPQRGPAPERVSLAGLAPRLFEELRAAHPEVPFTWCAEAQEVGVAAPDALLWEALWNLLNNAVNYRCPERDLHIELRAWQEQEEVWLEVRDNGRGLEQGEEQRLFRRGRRGASSTGVEGSGLGLFSVRSILEKCGGRVWAQPLDCGTAFRVALPRADN